MFSLLTVRPRPLVFVFIWKRTFQCRVFASFSPVHTYTMNLFKNNNFNTMTRMRMFDACVFAIMCPLGGLNLILWRPRFRKVPTGTKFTGQVLLVWMESSCMAKLFFFLFLGQSKIHTFFLKPWYSKTWLRGDGFLLGHLRLDFHCHLFFSFVIEFLGLVHIHLFRRKHTHTFLDVFVNHPHGNVRICEMTIKKFICKLDRRNTTMFSNENAVA